MSISTAPAHEGKIVAQAAGTAQHTWLGWISSAFFAVLVASTVTLNTRGVAGLSLVQDDFFYYAKIAQNIVEGHGSTFNGLVPTNGYHPLWMACQVVIQYLAQTMPAVLKTVEALAALSAFASFWISRSTMQRLAIAPSLGVFASLVISAAVWSLGVSGMEIILTIPLSMALVLYGLRLPEELSARHAFGYGFLAACTILSRLDSVLLVSLLCLALLAQGALRKRLNAGISCAFLLGLLPFFLYLATNLHFFHVLLPISGSAKQLRLSHGITFTAFTSISHYPLGLGALLLNLLGLVVLLVRWNRLPSSVRTVGLATLAFPFVHLAVISQASDWPVWSWYFYSAIVPLPLLLAICLYTTSLKRPIPQFVTAGTCLVLLAMFMAGTKDVTKHLLHRVSPPAERVRIAELLKAFAVIHPGLYAMGDRSGVVGQEMNEPIIQTEGLVMDKSFLNYVRKQDSLLYVLHQYKVRYYIASVPASQGLPHCLSVVEPAQGGPTVPKMRAILCADPIATYPGLQYNTAIYDLSMIH